jgi:hypothetical protein
VAFSPLKFGLREIGFAYFAWFAVRGNRGCCGSQIRAPLIQASGPAVRVNSRNSRLFAVKVISLCPLPVLRSRPTAEGGRAFVAKNPVSVVGG